MTGFSSLYIFVTLFSFFLSKVVLIIIAVVFMIIFICTPRGLDACKPEDKDDTKKKLRMLRRLLRL
jgi:hypothetical protein